MALIVVGDFGRRLRTKAVRYLLAVVRCHGRWIGYRSTRSALRVLLISPTAPGAVDSTGPHVARTRQFWEGPDVR